MRWQISAQYGIFLKKYCWSKREWNISIPICNHSEIITHPFFSPIKYLIYTFYTSLIHLRRIWLIQIVSRKYPRKSCRWYGYFLVANPSHEITLNILSGKPRVSLSRFLNLFFSRFLWLEKYHRSNFYFTNLYFTFFLARVKKNCFNWY